MKNETRQKIERTHYDMADEVRKNFLDEKGFQIKEEVYNNSYFYDFHITDAQSNMLYIEVDGGIHTQTSDPFCTERTPESYVKRQIEHGFKTEVLHLFPRHFIDGKPEKGLSEDGKKDVYNRMMEVPNNAGKPFLNIFFSQEEILTYSESFEQLNINRDRLDPVIRTFPTVEEATPKQQDNPHKLKKKKAKKRLKGNIRKNDKNGYKPLEDKVPTLIDEVIPQNEVSIEPIPVALKKSIIIKLKSVFHAIKSLFKKQ